MTQHQSCGPLLDALDCERTGTCAVPFLSRHQCPIARYRTAWQERWGQMPVATKSCRQQSTKKKKRGRERESRVQIVSSRGVRHVADLWNELSQHVGWTSLSSSPCAAVQSVATHMCCGSASECSCYAHCFARAQTKHQTEPLSTTDWSCEIFERLFLGAPRAAALSSQCLRSANPSRRAPSSPRYEQRRGATSTTIDDLISISSCLDLASACATRRRRTSRRDASVSIQLPDVNWK